MVLTVTERGANMNYFDAVQHRRSYYAIDGSCPVSDERLKELLVSSVKYAPSAFDCRSSRALLLLGNGHQTLWKIVLDSLRPLVPADKFPSTEQKISAMAAGYGTVLFYEDESVLKDLGERFPLYQENVSNWAEQGSGMLQYVVWTGLEAEGLGASLQHYNPLIDQAVAAAFGIPQTWRLIAQMPFGVPIAPPSPMDYGDAAARVRVVE